MAKEFSKKFYKSKEWKHCRSSYISEREKIDGGICEHCKDDVGYIVHHIEELTPLNINDPNITLNNDNLEYVCKKCHDNEHDFGRGKKSYTKKGYRFNEKGELVPDSLV